MLIMTCDYEIDCSVSKSARARYYNKEMDRLVHWKAMVVRYRDDNGKGGSGGDEDPGQPKLMFDFVSEEALWSGRSSCPVMRA